MDLFAVHLVTSEKIAANAEAISNFRFQISEPEPERKDKMMERQNTGSDGLTETSGSGEISGVVMERGRIG